MKITFTTVHTVCFCVFTLLGQLSLLSYLHASPTPVVCETTNTRPDNQWVYSPLIPFDFTSAFQATRPWVISIAAGIIKDKIKFDKTVKSIFEPKSEGSGVLWGKSRYIVTNAHVIQNHKEIRAKTYQKQVLRLEVLGIYKELDLAILKTSTPNALINLPSACYTETLPPVGTWVAAIGHPYSMTYSLSTGVVSAHHRGQTLREWARYFPGFLQTNITLNPGNSGGPLVDQRGVMIGLNTAIRQGAIGMSFTLPMSRIIPVVSQLSQTGQFKRSYLGLKLSTVSYLRGKKAGFSSPIGVRVKSVTAHGPAARAGLQKNDIIMAINGQVFNHPSSLSWRLISAIPEVPVTVEVVRSGATIHHYLTTLIPKSARSKLQKVSPYIQK